MLVAIFALIIDFRDVLLFPIYATIVYYTTCNLFRIKTYPSLDQKYFKLGLKAKIFAVIAFAIIHDQVYGGDTVNYTRNGASYIWDAFLNSPLTGLKIIFQSNRDILADTYEYTSRMLLWGGTTSSYMIKIVGFFSLFTFNSYTCIALFFSTFAFSGCWAVYKVFVDKFPMMRKKMAIAALFMPSLVFWGSGVIKDPLTLGAAGWVFYCFYYGLVLKRNIFKSVIVAGLSIFILVKIKLYIAMCLLPAAAVYIILEFNSRIKNPALKYLSMPLYIAVGGVLAAAATQGLSSNSERYELSQIAQTAAVTSNYIHRIGESKGGSVYDIGEMDGSLGNFLKLTPAAINVSLFRPYLWEVTNPGMLLAALESLMVLILTIRAIFRVGLINLLRAIISEPIILFSLVFSLLFATAVGITSGVFGSLVRYKIVLFPFYISSMFILEDYKKIKGWRNNVKTVIPSAIGNSEPKFA